jgi:putative intracellular protease/amidase
MTTKGKVLVLVASGHGLPLKDGKVYTGAGYYLNELTVPVRTLMNEGYEITFANPKGNTPQMDVHSAVPDFFGGDEAKLQDYLKFRDTLTGLKKPPRIADVIASGLDQYDAVFVPGGHGPMMDLLDDPDAGTVLRYFHKTSKPTAVLCHGPISLLAALPNSTEVLVSNKPYLGWQRHTWDPILLGIALTGVALFLRRWLALGPGGVRHGFTAARLSGKDEYAMSVGSAILGLITPQSITPTQNQPIQPFGLAEENREEEALAVIFKGLASRYNRLLYFPSVLSITASTSGPIIA